MPLVEEAVMADSEFEGQLGGVALEVPSTVDSQPNGRGLWFIHKWGIASLLRHFRKDADVEPAEDMQYPRVASSTVNTEDRLEEVTPTMPPEYSLDDPPGADQQVCYSSVRSQPEEGLAEPLGVMESVILSPEEPTVVSDRPWWPASYVMQWPDEEPESAVTAQSHVRARDRHTTTAVRLFWPQSYFGWFMFVIVVQAFTVVPLVWVLGEMLT